MDLSAADQFKDFIGHEWRWILLYAMLAFIMYWTAIVIEPTYHLVKEQDEQSKILKEILQRHSNITSEKIEAIEAVLTELEFRAATIRNLINASENVTIIEVGNVRP